MNSTTRHELLDKLYKDSNYSKLKSNRERVSHILDHIMDFDHFCSAIQVNIDQAKQKNGKNLSMAKNFKAEADLYLQQASLGQPALKKENLQNALKSYIQAILYYPMFPEVDHLAKLFVRKAQIHFQLKEFDAALYSIEVAIDICTSFQMDSTPGTTNGAQKKTARVEYTILKINCLKMLKRYQEAIQIINQLLNDEQLMKSSNMSNENLIEMQQNMQRLLCKEQANEHEESTSSEEKNQNATDVTDGNEDYFSYRIDQRCKIEHSPVVGRHFMATETIPEGTVLLEEKPYSIIIETDYLHKKCSNCYRELNYKFFPCAHCTELIFCDRKCFQNAYEVFHRHECCMVSVLKNITSPSFHVFRMISRIGPLDAYFTEKTKHNYSIDKYIKEPNQRTVPELKKTAEEKKRAYKMSSILWDHDSKHSLQANVHHTIIGIEISAMLEVVHGFLRSKPEQEEDFLINFIDMVIVDTRRIIFNVFGWHEYNDDWSLRGHVANCQCLVGSLINHSCVPNTNWEFSDGQIRFITNRTIQSGDEITITYGPNKDIPYNRRQERLNHYFFACKCKICVDDAKKGNALKCPNCSGPVPFGTSVNHEPVLSGQCLLCFSKYPDFDSNIGEFNKNQNFLKALYKFTKLNCDPTLLERAIDMIRKLTTMSVSPNPILAQSILTCSEIIQKYDNLTLEDKIEYGFLIDEHLPLNISIDMLETKTIDNMNYWMETFMQYITEKRSELKTEDECQAWNTLFRFQYRIRELLREFTKVEHNQTLKTIIASQMALCQSKVDTLKINHGQHLQFV